MLFAAVEKNVSDLLGLSVEMIRSEEINRDIDKILKHSKLYELK